jgi:hypothetical protein
MNYLPDQMLRNMEPQRLTKAQQREVDEQLGAAAAVISRRTGQVTRRVQAWAQRTILAEQPRMFFRKSAGQTASDQCTSACQERDNLAHALRK